MFNSTFKRFGLIVILTTSLALSGCGGGSGSSSTGSVLGGLDAAKKLFNAIRSNVLSIGNDQDTGFLQVKAKAMSDDFASLDLTDGLGISRQTEALNRGAELLFDAAASGGTPAGTLGTGLNASVEGTFYMRTWGAPPYMVGSNLVVGSSMTCKYYKTAGAGLPSASPPRTALAAGEAVCSYPRDSIVFVGANPQTAPMKVVVVKMSSTTTGSSSNATYNYSMAVLTFATVNCTDYFNASCAVAQSTPVTGAFSASRDSSGWTSITLTNGKLLANTSGAADVMASLNASLSSANGTDTVAMTGSMSSTSATDSTKTVSVTLLSGTKFLRTTATGAESGTLIGQIKTPGFQYDGTVSMSGTQTSTVNTATSASFTGKVSTVSGTTVTEFLNGTISADTSTKKASISAKVTNGSAVTSLSGSVDGSVTGQPYSITYNFGGDYSLTASGNAYENVGTPSVITFKASDGTRIELTQVTTPVGADSTSGKVFDSAGSLIGSIEPNSKQVNFVDGTYLMLL